jgi:hypothetical protein
MRFTIYFQQSLARLALAKREKSRSVVAICLKQLQYDLSKHLLQHYPYVCKVGANVLAVTFSFDGYRIFNRQIKVSFEYKIISKAIALR